MTQFCVYRLADDTLVLDLQSDLTTIGSRVIAPLIPPGPQLPAFTRLEPLFEIEGRTLALHTGALASVPSRLLDRPIIANLSDREYDIRNALDQLFSGF